MINPDLRAEANDSLDIPRLPSSESPLHFLTSKFRIRGRTELTRQPMRSERCLRCLSLAKGIDPDPESPKHPTKSYKIGAVVVLPFQMFMLTGF